MSRLQQRSQASGAMIFVDSANLIVERNMQKYLFDGNRDPSELNISDFDAVNFKFVADGSIVQLYALFPNWDQIQVINIIIN